MRSCKCNKALNGGKTTSALQCSWLHFQRQQNRWTFRCERIISNTRPIFSFDIATIACAFLASPIVAHYLRNEWLPSYPLCLKRKRLPVCDVTVFVRARILYPVCRSHPLATRTMVVIRIVFYRPKDHRTAQRLCALRVCLFHSKLFRLFYGWLHSFSMSHIYIASNKSILEQILQKR